jgi:cytochrome c-type biogenesis protein CcmH/NrfG
MNDDVDQAILSELRKLRRSSQVSIWLGVVVVAAGLTYIVFLRYTRPDHPPRVARQQAQPRRWDEVNAAIDREEYSNALLLAQAVVARQTNYYYGYSYLGNIHLALGDITNAEINYLRAWELWPDEENGKNLTAIRRRIAREQLPEK